MIGPYYVNTESRRFSAWGGNCSQVSFGTVTIDGRDLKCNRRVVGAFQAWENIRAKYDYKLTGTDTGFYSCRHINHNPKNAWSAHSWATALDVNWLENPAGSKLVTNIPREMIRELQGLKTNSGAFVFMWGGDWDRDGISTDHSFVDAMHWEVIAHPLDLESGIKGVPWYKVENVGLEHGDRGGGVKALQHHLNSWNKSFELREDGVYGDRTSAAVRVYQSAAGFAETGEADDTTLVHLYTNALRNPDNMLSILSKFDLEA